MEWGDNDHNLTELLSLNGVDDNDHKLAELLL